MRFLSALGSQFDVLFIELITFNCIINRCIITICLSVMLQDKNLYYLTSVLTHVSMLVKTKCFHRDFEFFLKKSFIKKNVERSQNVI